jgi:outer membrane protein assembly factor BamD (BamD/ComL family)
MNFAEAAYAYKYYKRNEYIDMAIKAAQRMLTVGGDPDIMKDTMLDLSQMYLDKKDYDKAIKYAIEYKNLYPGSLGYQKACYIEIMSHFMSISSYECDHSDALKTIELSNEFLKKYPDDNQYKEFIQQMIDSCYNILLQKEIHVINSYIAKYKRYKRITSITAAKRRILYIKKNIAPYLENANIVASNIENDIDKLIENR